MLEAHCISLKCDEYTNGGMYLTVTLKLKSSMIVVIIGIDDVNGGNAGDVKSTTSVQ